MQLGCGHEEQSKEVGETSDQDAAEPRRLISKLHCWYFEIAFFLIFLQNPFFLKKFGSHSLTVI